MMSLMALLRLSATEGAQQRYDLWRSRPFGLNGASKTASTKQISAIIAC